MRPYFFVNFGSFLVLFVVFKKNGTPLVHLQICPEEVGATLFVNLYGVIGAKIVEGTIVFRRLPSVRFGVFYVSLPKLDVITLFNVSKSFQK